jgi:hypothetical protein
LGGNAFADSDRSNPYARQQQIAIDLWNWAFADAEARREMTVPNGIFAGRIEYYLSSLLDSVPLAKRRGWWCDGVLELSITRHSRVSFRIAGVAYFDEMGVGPFELEFHFAHRRDVQPIRVILRCGFRDEVRQAASHRRSKTGAEVARLRPPRDDEWAIAVEFIPKEA